MSEYNVCGVDIDIIQKKMAEIISEVDRVCKEEQINYILYGGSLIGAIRHKGFIPWDDDLDIAMLRDDYEKFVEIAQHKLSSDFVFCSIETESKYPYNFGKVRLRNTIFKEEFTQDLDIHHGIWIDVIPMDYICEKSRHKLKLIRKLVSFLTDLRYVKLKIAKGKWKRFFVKFLSLKFINRSINKLLKYDFKNRDIHKVNELCHYGENKGIYEVTMFKDTIRVPFAGQNLCVPKEYDTFLRTRYGDYLELPPQEKQTPCHILKEVQL